METERPDLELHTLRINSREARAVAKERFAAWLSAERQIIDAAFTDARHAHVAAVFGTGYERPILAVLRNHAPLREESRLWTERLGDWALIPTEHGFSVVSPSAEEPPLPVSETSRELVSRLLRESLAWAGEINKEGDHEFDPRTPSPGTHFRTNLLIGDRTGFPHPLLTTPKAVVDEWGRGSSRAHADRQIYATRWDLLPHENGFPANRQFYLLEKGQQFFYSAAPPEHAKVTTRHAANRTIIRYELPDGLEVERTLFVLSAENDLPLGVEAQLIRVTNRGETPRRLEIIVTGMFGFIYPAALHVDVLYTCITVEPGVCHRVGSLPLFVAPRYTAGWGTEDRPFHLSQVVGEDRSIVYPTEFCLDYRRFIGRGTLEHPETVAALDNHFPAKGPAFFALKLPLEIGAGGMAECQSFTGLVSQHEGKPVTDETLLKRLSDFAKRAADPDWAHRMLTRVVDTQEKYRRAVQIRTPCSECDRLVNVHLPFQIRYQSYASRSFGLTQKGFRQIGFREIQDLLAGIIMEIGAGRADHAADLIGVWASHVHEFGYADHQFYWTGTEPGRYSDDALWLFQAVARYVDVTGDYSILDREWPVAGLQRSRSLYETLKAILHYSGRISVGRHGLPLIDHADWNDTLNLDGEGLHGPEKEALYRKQLAEGVIRAGEPIKTDLSESVMNGFLLEVARSALVRFARRRGEREAEEAWLAFGVTLRDRLQQAWKGDFFARAYINRENPRGITYVGAQGDGLSGDPNAPGTYFLNSFSWSVLSDIATDEQIRIMLDRIEEHLVTPIGIRLSSKVRFDWLMGQTGSGDYAFGDRENGGVFKHAAMMAVVAMLRAAKRVADVHLAERLVRRAWDTLQVTAPFATLQNPCVLAGNPRFCTQYVNPATGEHVGPLVSGTAPWMWMAYLTLLGVEFQNGEVELDPVLPPEWEHAEVYLAVPPGIYAIRISKPKRFTRCHGAKWRLTVNGEVSASQRLPRTGAVEIRVLLKLGC